MKIGNTPSASFFEHPTNFLEMTSATQSSSQPNEKEHKAADLSMAPAISMPMTSIPGNQKKPLGRNSDSFQIVCLKGLLKKIEKEKRDLLASKHFIHQAVEIFKQTAKEDPGTTVLKCSAVAGALACFHPVIVGSAACLLGYDIGNYRDLYSSDKELATNASLLFSNAGQAACYFKEGMELAIACLWLFGNVYNKAMSEAIKGIYSKHITSSKCDDLKEILHEKANTELARWGGFIAETSEIESVLKEIEEDKKKELSKRNVLRMIAYKFIKNTRKSPWKTLLKTSLVGFTALALHPLIIGLIGCGTSYAVADVSDLYPSSDKTAMTNAIYIFSNTGHIPAYAFVSVEAAAAATSILFDRKKVIRGIIEKIYDARIQKPNISKKTISFLIKKRIQDLADYT